MTEFKIVVEILAPPATVFAVLCDVERWPNWTPTMTAVRRLDQGPFTVGSRAEIEQPKLRPSVWTVSQIDANRSFTWSTKSPGVRMVAGHLIEPVAAGSLVTLTITVTGLLRAIVARLYGGLIDEYVSTEAKSLLAHCEALAAGQKTAPNYAVAAP
ncbi:MAG TPA: SRPBCC family protein [Steroidobacteraceae bacterium]|jgi:uncharacterized protein YndB with AHSA1/START domain